MTIKQQGGIFGRNPTFNQVEASDLTVRSSVPTITIADTDTTGTHTLKASNANLDVSADPSGVQAGSGIRFFVDGDEKVKINSTGNIVISNSGNGIDFSATSGTGTSELFNDYEEGSWSPVVADATTGGNTASITVVGAKYIKIGKIVHLYLKINNINTTGMTSGNVLSVQGLPFTSGVDVFSCGSCVLDRIGAGGDTVINPRIDESSSVMQFSVTSSDKAIQDSGMLVSAVGSTGSDIHSLQITYEAS